MEVESCVFTTVELMRNKSLGAGSYGVVCKAKCDKLICAAKLLYSVLFEVDDHSAPDDHKTPMNRFRRECQLLSRINHPNIVQYLGTYTDPGTKVVALLMELMDESLTRFLEKDPWKTLPFHIQTDIGHDVILALTYLHSNNIIHRDLSSNNVLLTASHRAKVSDFGMSTVKSRTGRSRSHTLCPGTVSYMPPEALNEQHVVCNKSLDCFSFGVLLVQIHTRLFPEPTNRFRTVKMVSPSKPSEPIDAMIHVPEVERRQSHIRLIEQRNPLLQIVCKCLKNSESDRPSADEIFDFFEELKATDDYTMSRDKPDGGNELLQESLEELEQQLSLKDQVLLRSATELQSISKALKEKNEEVKVLTAACRSKDVEISSIRSILEVMIRENEHCREENEHCRDQMRLLESTVQDLQFVVENREEDNREEDYVDVVAFQRHHNHSSSNDLEEVNKSRRSIERVSSSSINQEATKSGPPPGHTEGLVSSTNPTIAQGKNLGKENCEEDQEAPPFNFNVQIEWMSASKAPFLIQAGSTAVSKNRLYCRPANSNDVYELCLISMEWRKLKNCPNNKCTIVTIDDSLVAIGGAGTKKLMNFIENPDGSELWKEIYPPMKKECSNSAAAYSNGLLIVAGGFGSNWTILSSVEVLDTGLHTWMTAQSLPHTIYSASATICNDTLYIVGGYFEMGRGHFSAVACPMSVFAALSKNIDSEVNGGECTYWYKLTDLPVCRSACLKIRGKLAVVGGRMVNGSHSSSMCIYEPDCDKWIPVSNIALPRSECHAAVINDKKIVIVGGDTNKGLTSNVEMGRIIII